MRRWAALNGLRPSGPAREVYHRFGADLAGYALPERVLATSPEEYVTEVQLPVDEA